MLLVKKKRRRNKQKMHAKDASNQWNKKFQKN